MSNHPRTIWTDERKQSVAKLLREGLTATQISKHIGVSRGAVIGIVHRDPMLSEIGLAGSVGGARRPKQESAPYRSGRMRTAARRPLLRTVAPATSSPVVEPEPPTGCEAVSPIATELETIGLPLVEISARQCRFPVNNAAQGEQHLFCGHQVKDGSSFCEHHHRRVFVRPPKGGLV